MVHPPTAPSVRALIAALALVVAVVAPRAVHAQAVDARVYVVASGDSLSAIAEHLGVPEHSLAERNHLDPPFALRVGRRLRLPGGVASDIVRALPFRDGRPPAALAATAGRNGRSWGRPRHPGTVNMVREADDETMVLNLRRVSRTTQRRMEHFLRFGDGRSHPIDPRLMRQLATVSDHFGGRQLHVISGFRPWRHGQYTAHSNHNIGHAVDFRVEGVPNRTLRDYCRTFARTGCGFYPRSVFVHMDVRDESTTWVDWSRPGQRPIYGREDRPPEEGHATARPAEPSAAGDESVEEVAEDSPRVRTAPPASDDAPATATTPTPATPP